MKPHRHPSVLSERIRAILRFYYPDCIDTRFGGYIAQLDEQTGCVYDGETKHLVATARAVHNFSIGVLMDGPVWCRTTAEHGLQFLSTVHWDDQAEGYDHVLKGRETVDDTRYCYAQAYVALAAARAYQAGIPGAEAELERALGVVDKRFWEPEYGMCAEWANGDWSDFASYRGQNGNMHTCEATIAAYEATGDERHLDWAYTIAESFVQDLPERSDGLLWEHYTAEWEPDMSYNRDQPRHQFRPWGYQPGHHLEWAKLLLVLRQYRSETWLVERARELFEAAAEWWDDEYGGFYYTVEADGTPVVDDKYGWPVAEGIGSTALLAAIDESYLQWYDRLWDYADSQFIDPRHGNWYERLSRKNKRNDPNRGTAVEPGYHPVNNYWIAKDVFEDRPS